METTSYLTQYIDLLSEWESKNITLRNAGRNQIVVLKNLKEKALAQKRAYSQRVNSYFSLPLLPNFPKSNFVFVKRKIKQTI